MSSKTSLDLHTRRSFFALRVSKIPSRAKTDIFKTCIICWFPLFYFGCAQDSSAREDTAASVFGFGLGLWRPDVLTRALSAYLRKGRSEDRAKTRRASVAAAFPDINMAGLSFCGQCFKGLSCSFNERALAFTKTETLARNVAPKWQRPDVISERRVRAGAGRFL